MKSLYGILTIILNCCNISCSAIQKDCLLAPPLSRLHFYFSFLFRLQDCIKDVYLSHCILNLK